MLAAGVVGLSLHAGYALFGPGSSDRLGELAASWAFYGLALLAVGASVARSGLVHDERPAWVATSIAFGAWFIGSVSYASGGSVDDTLYSFSIDDALLAPFAVRGRVCGWDAGALAREAVPAHDPARRPDRVARRRSR